jgi:DNA polymerase kappa
VLPAAKFFGNVKEDAVRPTKRRKLTTEAGPDVDALAGEPIYIDSDGSEDETLADKKRAATATPEKSHTERLPEVDLAPRASSHEPMGSQDAFAVVGRLPIKRKREHKAKLASGGKQRPNATIGDDSADEEVQSSSSRLNEQHVCPICSKTLQTDNAGLNAHVDWCLSRSAILEASASGSPTMTLQQVERGGGTKKSTPSNAGAKPGSSKGSSMGGKQDIRFAWKIL